MHNLAVLAITCLFSLFAAASLAATGHGMALEPEVLGNFNHDSNRLISIWDHRNKLKEMRHEIQERIYDPAGCSTRCCARLESSLEEISRQLSSIVLEEQSMLKDLVHAYYVHLGDFFEYFVWVEQSLRTKIRAFSRSGRLGKAVVAKSALRHAKRQVCILVKMLEMQNVQSSSISRRTSNNSFGSSLRSLHPDF